MDAIKQTIESVAGAAKEKTEGTPAGTFPHPDDYPVNSQRDSKNGPVVGIQADMGKAPIDVDQEGKYGFESYKAAGKLLDKKCLVTGGDSGIGRSAAVMFALEGADVGIVYLPEEQVDAEETQRLILKAGRQALLIPQDIRSEEGCISLVQKFVAKFGRIDCLVNNASVMYDCPSIVDLPTEQFKRTMETNIFGTFYITRAAVPHIPRGGSIIFTTSQVAFAGPPSLLDYAMTKGAQTTMMRVLSNQLLADKGIRVSSVAPGPVWTPLQEAAMDHSTLKTWHQTPAPIGRIGQPSELGPAFVFLASSDGSFISGQTIHVNGGAMVSS